MADVLDPRFRDAKRDGVAATRGRERFGRAVIAGRSWSCVDVKPVLDLPDEAVEECGELLLLGMVRRLGGDGQIGALLARVGQPDGSQVGVLDGPSVAS